MSPLSPPPLGGDRLDAIAAVLAVVIPGVLAIAVLLAVAALAGAL